MLDALRVLSLVPMLEPATEAELQGLADRSLRCHFTRGEVIFAQGSRSDDYLIVVSGRVQVVIESDRGSRFVLSVLSAGNSLGELSALDGLPRSAGVEALDDASVLFVPSIALRELLERSPRVSLAFIEDLCALVRRNTGATADLVFLDLPRRLAKLLIDGDSKDHFEDTSQADVAARLGVTRPSLNRALSGFQRRSWVKVGRGRIVVLDRVALQQLANSWRGAHQAHR